jgi:hypothetical protein
MALESETDALDMAEQFIKKWQPSDGEQRRV